MRLHPSSMEIISIFLKKKSHFRSETHTSRSYIIEYWQEARSSIYEFTISGLLWSVYIVWK